MSLGLGFGLPFRAGAGLAVQLPNRADLIQLLTGTTDGLHLTDSVGVLDQAEICEVPCLSFDGVDDYVSALNTGLGLADFYYEVSFVYVYKKESYLFCDGDAHSSGKWSSLQYASTVGGLIFLVDDDITRVDIGPSQQIVPSGSIADNDVIHGYVKRVSGVISWNLTNVTTDAVYSGSQANTTDFSGGTGLALGAVHSTVGVYVVNSPLKWCLFKAGTSSENITRHYVFESGSGTKLYDVSSNGNDGTISGATWTTADGIPSYAALNGFRLDGAVQIPALADGSAAADGNPITNPGGKVANGASVKYKQTDPRIVPSVVVTYDTVFFVCPYLDMYNSKPRYRYSLGDIITVSHDGAGNWTVDDTIDSETVVSDTYFPPKTGYTSANFTTAVDYDSWWVDSGEFTSHTYAEWLARTNLTQDQVDQVEDADGVDVVKESGLYAQGSIAGFTAAELAQATKWAERYE